MGLHKLTAGDGYTYLTRQVAAHDSTERGHTSLRDYYAERGESPGRWLGAGLAGLGIAPGETVTAEQMKSLFGVGRHPNAAALERAAAQRRQGRAEVTAAGALGRPFNVYTTSSTFNARVAQAFSEHNRDRGQRWNAAIDVEVRAEIRSTVGRQMFVELHDRAPLNARELSGFVARASRQATTAVAGYDLTFSPVKSVSTLWALSDRATSGQILAAHDAAVADTIGWIEREAAFTRVGHGGVRQVAVRGLIATAFTHRDTRAGDPALHTHVAVSNKVETVDGRWLALDGRVLHKAAVAASERYNTRLEAELRQRLGLTFRDSPTAPGKRPVREIVGVNPLLIRWWSRRRQAIETRRSELATNFQASHGRSPTPVEAIALAQQATLETREAKHPPRSEADQRRAWRSEAIDVLVGEDELDRMLGTALRPRSSPDAADQGWPAHAAAAVVHALENDRASWQIWHVRAEAERQVRAAGVDRDGLDRSVAEVVDQVLADSIRLGVADPVSEPPELHRANGESVYDVHGSANFTSARVLAAEEQVLDLARAQGGRRISDVRVEVALAESAAEGVELNDAQAAMVRDLATSGLSLQLALAPAGTGKTTAMGVLSKAWTDAGGTVVGLAPSAQAASELQEVVGGRTDTLAKLTWTIANAPREEWPGWVRSIGSSTLVVIDEAGQASTPELAAAAAYVTGRGGVVRLIGDDQQLAAVGAGGVLRDIRHTVGATTLSEVRRFDDHVEAAVTLAVRDGDAGSLGFYADNDRIHVGDIASVTDDAYAAWSADLAAGRDSILIAPTRELVSRLNGRARADRLAAAVPTERTTEVALADGNRASIGDAIVTRRNDRCLTLSPSDWVRNGDRWTVTAVHHDGSICARRTKRNGNAELSIRIPSTYVSTDVQLGYASTVHGAQGMTVDTSHTVVTGNEARQLLYVAISRGRQANHIYLANGHDGDVHSLIRPETLRPPTAIDVLAEVLTRDGSQHSATSIRRDADSPATQLHQATLRYQDAVDFASAEILGPQRLAALDTEVELIWPGLTVEPAYHSLRSKLAQLALAGHDAVTELADAGSDLRLGPGHDRAAILDYRLRGPRGEGPLPWLVPIPTALTHHEAWCAYLQARGARITALAESVGLEADAWTPTTAPTWAKHLMAPEHRLVRRDIAAWRAASQTPDEDTRPTGTPRRSGPSADHQKRLERRLKAAIGSSPADDANLSSALPVEVQADPHVESLNRRLIALANAGLDAAQLIDQALLGARPMPDERPADALWWRIAAHLGPAALSASGQNASTLHPSWEPSLDECLGSDTAARVKADAAWPALVAAIGARPKEWSAPQLIEAVTRTRVDVPVDELCSALVWRVASMTDLPLEDDADPSDPVNDVPTTQPDPLEVGPSVSRIHELNQQALEHYVALFPLSWAPEYVRTRLGTDLTDQPQFAVGYAAPGPDNLVRHLTALGATADELTAAGLARNTDDHRVVDAFRDRLVFPIYDESQVAGFIARRNPTKDPSVYAGPKYLNTKTTAAFSKGNLLYGLAEGRTNLEKGASPVLVEGPMDAIAVSIVSGNNAVGIAPLGTSFTECQSSQLEPFFRTNRANVVIATDPDAAGWQSAQRAFWRLAALGANPRHLALPDELDPADIIRIEGAAALRARLEDATSFGAATIDRMLEDSNGALADPAARIWLARDAAKVIGALPPQEWSARIEQVAARVDLPPGILQLEVVEAGEAWTEDAGRQGAHMLQRLANRATASPRDEGRRPVQSHAPTRTAAVTAPRTVPPSARGFVRR